MTRPAPRLMMAACGLLVLAGALLAWLPADRVGAQAPGPDAALSAAQTDLASRLGTDSAGLVLLRAEAVIWNDGCLGAAGPDELCSQALVDGFVLWIGDGRVAYRYHTDAPGIAVRLGESMIPLSQVPVAPLPQGAVLASALGRLLDRLAEAGFDEIFVQELAALRDWIPGAFSPHYIVGAATLEIFEVGSVAEAEAAIERLRPFGGDADLGEDQVLWRDENLIIILLASFEHAAVRDAVSGIVGLPVVETTLDTPRLRPEPAALDTSVDAVIGALTGAGFEAMRTEVAVHRPFLPADALSAVLAADAVSIEVFALLDPDAVAAAVAKAAADPAGGALFVIWARGSTLVLVEGPLQGAQRAIIDAISPVLGAPRFLGDEVGRPGEGSVSDGEEPVALPATGTGGVSKDDSDTPDWVWGVIAGVAVAAVVAGGAYRLWLRSRSR